MCEIIPNIKCKLFGWSYAMQDGEDRLQLENSGK